MRVPHSILNTENNTQLYIPKLGILTPTHDQIIHQLVLHQLFLLQKLECSSELLCGQAETWRHVIVAQILIAKQTVDEAHHIIIVEGTCDGGDESFGRCHSDDGELA